MELSSKCYKTSRPTSLTCSTLHPRTRNATEEEYAGDAKTYSAILGCVLTTIVSETHLSVLHETVPPVISWGKGGTLEACAIPPSEGGLDKLQRQERAQLHPRHPLLALADTTSTSDKSDHGASLRNKFDRRLKAHQSVDKSKCVQNLIPESTLQLTRLQLLVRVLPPLREGRWRYPASGAQATEPSTPQHRRYQLNHHCVPQ